MCFKVFEVKLYKHIQYNLRAQQGAGLLHDPLLKHSVFELEAGKMEYPGVLQLNVQTEPDEFPRVQSLLPCNTGGIMGQT